MSTGAFKAVGSRETLHSSLVNSCAGGYRSVDMGFEKAPLPSRWLTNDPAGDFGIPEELAYLECGIFGKLPPVLAGRWPERFVNAIPEGADLVGVADRLVLWLLRDPASSLMIDVDAVQRLWRERLPIGRVAGLYHRKLSGGRPDDDTVEALRLEIENGTLDEVRRRETPVIYASSALLDAVRYVADPAEAAHLPSSVVRCVAMAAHELEKYSPEARKAFRRTRQYVDGPGYRYRAECNLYGAAADALVRYIMEAPRVGG